MPEFSGSITSKQADALVGQMFKWLVDDYTTPGGKQAAVSIVAAIICDAVHADITLQPLHDAYGRKVGYQK